ncbi:MAG: DUF2905 domain-containing protein [Anaerolineae bacterium]
MDWNALGRMLILMGLILCLVGVGFLLVGKVPYLGRLPGDIRIEREGFSCYIPIVTMLLLSLLLTVVLNVVLRLLGPR